MRRLKVVQVIPELVPYGAERMVATLALNLDRTRFEPAVVSLYGESHGSLASMLGDGGVKVIHLNKQKGLDWRMFSRFAETLAELRPDVVHTHNYVMRYTIVPSIRQNVPLLVHTLHNVADRELDRVGTMLQRWAFRRRVHPVSIAEKVTESYERVYRLPRPVLIPNGIEIEPYAEARAGREEWRRREGYSAGDLLFVCVARMMRQKNHSVLLEAFAEGPAHLPNARLLLAGDGGLEPELRMQAKLLNIESRVDFLGRRGDVPEVLGAADVFVLSSLWEGNPLSVMEAMAAGLPVVVTAVGGVPELVEHGRSGLLVAAGDAHAFAKALMDAVREPAALRQMGEAASRRARDRFDHRRQVRAYEDLYLRLLAAPGRERTDGTRAA